MYHILICDDEKDIVSALKIYLTSDEYCLHEAYDGRQALALAREQNFQLILLDIMMPLMDGLEAMREIRKISNVPIILLTAKGEDYDKVLGLNAGADDYITKPFNPVEVIARVRSALRRYTSLGAAVMTDGELQVAGIVLNDNQKVVTLEGEPVSLTPTEYEILKLLMQNPGRVFSPQEIYRLVWQDAPYGAESTVAVHIRHLREKLEINPGEPRYIKVVWGQGYKIEGR